MTVGGADILIPRGVSARVLLVLAASPGSVVRDATLIDRLWSDDRAPRSMGALRNAVMRLRDSLGDRADVVERTGEGYRLGAAVELDTQRFDAAVTEAAARRACEPDAARALVQGALALVRGEPFGDVASEAWARSTVNTCTERIAEAEEVLGELIVQARDRAGVAVLLRHADDRPERELRWIQLMTLLDSIDRRTEALRAYRRARSELAEFGLQPGPALRRLADAIADDIDEPPERATSGTDRPFFGRDQLIAAVRAALEPGATVTLVGIGGAGKTRIARELVRSLRDDTEFEGTTVWVDFTAIDEVGLVDMTFVSAAGLGSADRPASLGSAELLSAALGDDDCLVVLDNAEHVNDGVAVLATQLAQECPKARVLVTSRDRLGLDSERVIVVSPLPTPATSATAEECAANDAVRLLRYLAGDQTDPVLAARLVRAVGGLPLGVELVASMARHVPLVDLTASLERSLPGLALDRPGYQPRQRLTTVFAHAVDHLSPTDRNLFALLSGFTAPFTLRSAEQVGAACVPGLELDSPVVASLVRLAEAGLVQVEPGEPQLFSLTPLQTAAANRLLDGVQQAAIVAWRDEWYQRLAADQGRRLRGDGQIEALRLIDAEFGNLLTVAYGMLQAGRPRDSLAITGQLADYWRLGRNQSVGLQLLVAGLEADPHDDSLERLRALVTLPFAASTFAGIARHESTSRQAAGMAARLGRRDLEDEALLGVGLAEAWTGRRVEGFETLGRVAGSAVNPWAAANARLIRSLMLILAGQIDAARRGVHALARQLRAAGDRIGEATAFMHLAVGLQRHGDPADAEEAARRSLELSGDEMPFVTMHSNYVLGLILDERRDPGGAELLRTVQIHFRHVGDLGCLNGVNRALADVSRRLGRDHEALELLREVVWLLPEVDQQETAASLLQVAEIYLARGHTRQAGVLGTAAANLIGGSGIGWNVRQRQRLDSVLEQSGGDDSPSTPIEDVIGVALHP